MGTDPEFLKKKAAPWRRRWRIWLLVLGILLLLVIVFQKAILLAAIRWEIAHYAAGAGLELRCEVGGDPIRYLEITDLDLQMKAPDSLQSLKIKRIKATYNIMALVFSGWSHALGEVEVEGGILVLREAQPGQASDEDSLWVPFPNSLKLKNFNLEQGAMHLRGLDLTLLPRETGSFKMAELALPNWGTWKGLSAGTRYERGEIELQQLELKPYATAESLKLDATELSEKKFGLSFRGLLFKGQAELAVDWQRKKEGDFFKIAAKTQKLSLDEAAAFFKPEQMFGGEVQTLDLQFSGLWQDRGTWDGAIQAALKNGTVNYTPAWKTVDLKAEILKGQVTLDQVALFLDARNQLGGKGSIQLTAPFRYSGELQGNLTDLGALQGFLEMAGETEAVAGSLEVNWTGQGEGGLEPGAKHEGKGFLNLSGASWGEKSGIEAQIRGTYTPEQASFDTVQASFSGWRVTGTGNWKDRRLKLPDLQIFHGERQLLKGMVDVPFYPGDWKHPGQWLNPEDPVAIQLQGRGIQLEALMKELGSPSPWKGEASLDLTASGALKELQLQGSLEGKNLIPGWNPDFLPAQLKMDLSIREGRLNAFATLTQPALEPVKIWGSMEFQAANFLNGSKEWQKVPIRAELAMAALDLTRTKRFFPSILDIQGRLGADIHLAGSIEDPMLWGEIDLNVPRLRFNQRAIPNLTALVGRFKFEKDRMQVETMRGNLAGGPFEITGSMDFSKLADPIMDMKINGKDLLLYRDDHVTSRANVVLTMKGPFNKAKVEGTVALTKSQFFRNIDILPIGLPGRSAPEVPRSVLPEFSIKLPPIRDWSFDIKISNKDPFLVKGNLANGKIDAQLHLTGTGLAPQLEGVVSITNLEATLPFSTMVVDRGYLYFKPGQGLNANLDFHGTSKIQDYQVTAYVYGTLLRPQTLFVSQPPLSEQDIIALIATGSTTTELTSDSSVIAGKATSLLFQKIWRKLFPNSKIAKNELLDRVSFNVGSLDPDNASPALGASLKVTDDIYVIFDSGTEGSFRGRVKYLIRFR